MRGLLTVSSNGLVYEGLSARRKSLPCRFFYDAAGSALFEHITQLPEYYLTRAELEILEAHGSEMVELIRDGGALVEFGSGSSLKTELLFPHVSGHVDYVPIDVSETALALACSRLSKRFANVSVHPIVADFSRQVALPRRILRQPKIGFFPGSTIGNLEPSAAAALLAHFRDILAAPMRLIVGVDVVKDVSLLLAAYNDSEGLTAAFNLNLLTRINRELGASFVISGFRHEARYNERLQRVEMHIVSQRDQDVRVGRHVFRFERDETIHTENCYKYTLEGFRALARSAGFAPEKIWQDGLGLFSVHALC